MVLYIVLDFGSWTTFVQVFKVEVFDDEDEVVSEVKL